MNKTWLAESFMGLAFRNPGEGQPVCLSFTVRGGIDQSLLDSRWAEIKKQTFLAFLNAVVVRDRERESET